VRQRAVFMVILIISSCLFIFKTGGVGAQKTMPDTITLRQKEAKLAPVTFSHRNHAGFIMCVVCHHNDSNLTKPKRCIACHPDRAVKEKAMPAQQVFHKQCQGCHKERRNKGTRGPVKCNECHKGLQKSGDD